MKGTGAVIQARMGSQRLPGKVLMELPPGSSFTVLDRIINRVSKSSRLDAVIIATSKNKADDAIAAFSKTRKIPCFRGDETNLLSRYCDAATAFNLKTVVRLTGDNPCVAPNLVDSTVQTHLRRSADYTYTTKYPLGIDVEVFDIDALRLACQHASKPYEYEHVSPYFFTNPGRFRIIELKAPVSLRKPEIRLTMDTREDYIALCALFDLLAGSSRFCDIKDFIHAYEKHEWIKLLNGFIPQKSVVTNRKEELREAVKLLRTYGMNHAASLIRYSPEKHSHCEKF